MDYIITMTDGSKYLAHHGVLGMRWGVHNDETKRKYGELGPKERTKKIGFGETFKENLKVALTGKGEMKTIQERRAEAESPKEPPKPKQEAPKPKQEAKPAPSSKTDKWDVSPTEYYKHQSDFFDESCEDYRKRLDAIQKYSEDYKKDEDRWIRLATECINVEHFGGKMTEAEKREYDKDMKGWSDFNQGTNNSYAIYLHETGQTDKFFKDYHKAHDEFISKLYENARKHEIAMGKKDSGLADILKDEVEESLWDSFDSNKDNLANAFAFEMTEIENSKTVDADVLAKAKVLMKTLEHSDLDASKCLVHHGIEGMKWGVWNEETRRKYLGTTSAKGDKLRKKAASKRLEAEKARTDKAVLAKAAKVHSNDITKAYAKANTHRIKQQASERRANEIKRKKQSLEYQHLYESKGADIPMGKKLEKKIHKLDKKAEKFEQKAKREDDAAKRESDKGHAASKRIERHNIAVREMDAKAAKLNAKAAQLERKAEKADAKQDAKVAKAAEQVRESSKKFVEEGRVASGMDRANLAAASMKYVASTNSGSAKLGFLGSVKVKDRAKFDAEVERVMVHSIVEAAAIAEHGKAAVDLKLEEALGTKKAYRYL